MMISLEPAMGKLLLVSCPSQRTSNLLHALSEAGYMVHLAPDGDPKWLQENPGADVVVEQERAHLVSTPDPIVIAGQVVTPAVNGTPLPVLLRMVLQAQQDPSAGPAHLQHLMDQAAIVHDFGNVLTVVSGAACLLLQNDNLQREERTLVKGIQEFVMHGQLVARRLLHGPTYTPVLVDLNELTQRTLHLLQRTRPRESLMDALHPEALFVRTEPAQLQRAILNLVLNALDAAPEGVVTVHTGADAERVFVSVEDDGIGMSPDVQARVFEPFFTTASTGAGLGLQTVREIVDRSGGQVTINSAPGEGCTVTVYLPKGTNKV